MTDIIDLRSDTVTRPTPEMRRVIHEAEVGDDVFGDDPTVIRLQEKVATILGKEAALFVPSGTMANVVAMCCHTSPGDEVYLESGCHVYNFEGGGAALISGVMFNPIEGDHGSFKVEEVEARLRHPDHHFAPSKLVWIENSANRAGGTIFPQTEILKIKQLVGQHGLKYHLDGARLWNVAAATGKSEAELAEPFDSVNICLSKGLGAPIGSLIAGSEEFIDQAHRFRKRLGGGMRQVGIIAAAGLYALENHRSRLREDHQHARRLGEAINDLSAFSVALDHLDTNIIVFNTAPGAMSGPEVNGILSKNGVLGTSFGGTTVRLVTHLDVNDKDIDRTIEVFRRCFRGV